MASIIAFKESDMRLTVAQNFVAGGVAGVAARMVTAPLDVMKILFQVGSADTKNGFLNAMKTIYKREGLSAFWKGNVIACVRLFPYSATKFATFNAVRPLFSDENGKLTHKKAMACGATAGVMATVLTYPLDLIKTRLTVQDNSAKKYKSIIHAFKTIIKEEGAGALYQGIVPSLLGVMPYEGLTFMCYEFMKLIWGKPVNELGPALNFLNGCLAGAFAQTFTFPFDTVRKMMHVNKSTGGGASIHYNGMIDCMVQTVKKDGIFGLWRGTTANLIKVTPYAGMIFLGFEFTKRIFLFKNGYTTNPFKEVFDPEVNQNWKPHQVAEFKKKKLEGKK